MGGNVSSSIMWFPRRLSSPTAHQWYDAKCGGLAVLDFFSLWFFTCSTSYGFIWIWGRVNCSQIVVRFIWVTVANFRIGKCSTTGCVWLNPSDISCKCLQSVLGLRRTNALTAFPECSSMHSFNLSWKHCYPSLAVLPLFWQKDRRIG